VLKKSCLRMNGNFWKLYIDNNRIWERNLCTLRERSLRKRRICHRQYVYHCKFLSIKSFRNSVEYEVHLQTDAQMLRSEFRIHMQNFIISPWGLLLYKNIRTNCRMYISNCDDHPNFRSPSKGRQRGKCRRKWKREKIDPFGWKSGLVVRLVAE